MATTHEIASNSQFSNSDVKCITKTIKASSRASIKVGDNFYTIEYTEEQSVPEQFNSQELATARKDLWDTCNTEVDNQIVDILNTFSNKNKAKN